MKSKEALNKLQHNFGNLQGQALVNCYEIIEKDLEELEWHRKLFNEPIQALIKNLKILETLKPLCEVYETPKRHEMYLRVMGVVVYQFQLREQFNLFKEWLENDK